jgi:uncharacterized membrane protein YdfJ with MMPL/SSD domain
VGRSVSVNGAYEALGRFVVRFRWAVVVFWLLVAVVTTAALPSLGSEVNDNNSAFLSQSAPSSKAANLAAPLLVPSTVILLGRRNWWPSSLGREDEIGYRAGPPWPDESSSSPETASARR